MIKWLKKRLGKENMKVWAYRFDVFSSLSPWTKVVSVERPKASYHGERVIGPFRSEVDCEEFCDQNNIGIYNAKVYNKEVHRVS